jgi:hypothetical protein
LGTRKSVTDYLELGAYLQTMVTPSEGVQFGGWKLRAKLAPEKRAPRPPVLGAPRVVGLTH